MSAETTLGEFAGWWREQIGALLRGVLPAGWRPAPLPVRTIVLERDGRLTDDASIGRADAATPAILALPPGMLLARDITLPLAVGRDLAQAAGFEMDRLTPFTADELHWSVRPLRRDPGRGVLGARLALLPRARVDAALAELAAGGVTPHALTDGQDEITLPAGLAWRRRERRRIAWAAAACLVLAGLAAWVPFVRIARQDAATEAHIAALQPQADAAQRLRSQLARRSTASAAFARARQSTGDALGAIAALTRALPDDTYLTSLGLHQLHLSFDGQSAAAAKLIGRITADPALREPSFAAPVTSTGTRDLFSIHATLATPAAEAKTP